MACAAFVGDAHRPSSRSRRRGPSGGYHGQTWAPEFGNGVAARAEHLQALYVDELRQSLEPPVRSRVKPAADQAGTHGRLGRVHRISGSPNQSCIHTARFAIHYSLLFEPVFCDGVLRERNSCIGVMIKGQVDGYYCGFRSSRTLGRPR